MMRKGGGKQKGASFERDVCKQLSNFILPGSKDTLFWRSSLSGGRATVQNRKGGANQTQLGDLTCVHEAGQWLTAHFVIECKFYADLDIEAGLLTGRGKLAGFWRELCKLSRRHRRHPMLIAKQNRSGTLLILDEAGSSRFSTFRPDSLKGHMLGALAMVGKEALLFNFEKAIL